MGGLPLEGLVGERGGEEDDDGETGEWGDLEKDEEELRVKLLVDALWGSSRVGSILLSSVLLSLDLEGVLLEFEGSIKFKGGSGGGEGIYSEEWGEIVSEVPGLGLLSGDLSLCLIRVSLPSLSESALCSVIKLGVGLICEVLDGSEDEILLKRTWVILGDELDDWRGFGVEFGGLGYLVVGGEGGVSGEGRVLVRGLVGSWTLGLGIRTFHWWDFWALERGDIAEFGCGHWVKFIDNGSLILWAANGLDLSKTWGLVGFAGW